MRRQLLVTATGEDRPGIVARLSEVFLRHGGNLEESRMALLGGEFAAIILVSAPSDKVQAMEAELTALGQEGIAVATKATTPLNPDRFKGYIPCGLSVSGADHEGIVHKVARYLRDQAVNIQSMESEVVSAPVTGTPLFSMRARIQVPPSLDLASLRKSLTAIGDEEQVEIEIQIPACV